MQTLAASVGVHLQNTGRNGHSTLWWSTRLENCIQFWVPLPCVRGAFKIDRDQYEDEEAFRNMSSKEMFILEERIKGNYERYPQIPKAINYMEEGAVLF